MVSPNTAKRANARAYAGRLDGRARKARAVGALLGQRGDRVGRDGEFTLAREAGGVRFRGVLCVNRTKALEAAADVARGRGDSAEEVGKVLAGVRWGDS